MTGDGFLAWAAKAEVDVKDASIVLTSSDRPVTFRYEPASGAEIKLESKSLKLNYASSEVKAFSAEGEVRIQQALRDQLPAR